MDVLLLDPGAAGSANWTIGVLAMPIKMALVQLYSYLRHHQKRGEPALSGVKLHICDLEWELEQPEDSSTFPRYAADVRDRLLRESFDLLAISCWSSLKYRTTLLVAEIAKAINPGCKIVVGGWHPSALPSDFLFEGSPVDHVITREGEHALLDLLRNWPKLPTQQIITSTLVSPDEEVELLWDEYPLSHKIPTAPIFFSRGCPFTCSYCMEPFTKGRSWRALPPEDAVGRLLHLVKTRNTRYIDVHDPIFAPQKTWRRTFLRGLIDAGFDRYMWCESRSDLFEEEDLALFGQLPIQMDFGTESASAEMLSIMSKTRNPALYLERSRQTLWAASRRGLASQVYLITRHPGERMQHVQETLAWFDHLLEGMGETALLQVSAQPYRYYPGTAVMNDRAGYYERYGTEVLEDGWWRNDGDPRETSACTVDTHLSETERQDIAGTWEVGLARLNQILLTRRSDVAARTQALRTASYIDLTLATMRLRAESGLKSPQG